MLNKKALAASLSAPPATYVEDVFSTYLYSGNSSTQTITNNIDLAGEGGMVWLKVRTAAANHYLFDTVRGTTKSISSNTTSAQATSVDSLTAFNANGFSLGAAAIDVNDSGSTYASWTFRKQPKFFDVVTFTSAASGNTTFSHNLGSTPGCVILKGTAGASGWLTYHRSTGTSKYLELQSTAAESTATNWISVNSTSVTVTSGWIAANKSYVAYLFAHDAGGFGDSGSESVIKCGSFTTPSSGLATIDLGYEPQWIMVKGSSNSGDWWMVDNMRGFSQTSQSRLDANTSLAEETTASPWFKPTATGFTASADSIGGSTTFIYIAIRRGPMKTPEAGTEVFEPFVDRTSIANKTNGTMGPVDLTMQTQVSDPLAGYHWTTFDRLRGANKYILTASTAAEATDTSVSFDVMGGVKNATWFSSGGVGYNFKRAPGFMDVVCYTGTGSARTVAHNLGVAPELYITKRRDSSTEGDWGVYHSSVGNTKALFLNTNGSTSTSSLYWNNTSPTNTNFSVGTWAGVNSSGGTYVAYLFASVTGVSKVGSYTGNGSSQTINCGFAGGSRFVLIKRTDSTGDWVVFDSARGIVSGNDPALYLNSTAAEVTTADAIDTDSTGFVVNQESTLNVNVNSASYIYLSIA